MAFELTGKVIEIYPTIQVSDKFRKREFVIEKKESAGGAVFVDYLKFQLVQDKCDLINESFLHEEVRILFNIRGNKWERDGKINYFTNLDTWKIEKLSAPSGGPSRDTGFTNPPEEIPPENDELSDLPF